MGYFVIIDDDFFAIRYHPGPRFHEKFLVSLPLEKINYLFSIFLTCSCSVKFVYQNQKALKDNSNLPKIILEYNHDMSLWIIIYYVKRSTWIAFIIYILERLILLYYNVSVFQVLGICHYYQSWKLIRIDLLSWKNQTLSWKGFDKFYLTLAYLKRCWWH